jgi:hypothetical protein
MGCVGSQRQYEWKELRPLPKFYHEIGSRQIAIPCGIVLSCHFITFLQRMGLTRDGAFDSKWRRGVWSTFSVSAELLANFIFALTEAEAQDSCRYSPPKYQFCSCQTKRFLSHQQGCEPDYIIYM